METLGPWGGNGGSWWDDGRYDGGVKEIIVKYGRCIDSITVVYNDNGNSVEVSHGGRGGSWTKITLDFPEEYLIGVTGFAADFNGLYVIRSLIFTTNKRRCESIGEEGGDSFNCVAGEHGDGLHISSFLGRSGLYLDAIGFYLSPLAEAQVKAIETDFQLSSLTEAQANAIEPMEKLGPWGGNGGSGWDDGKYDGGVKEIIVTYGQCIDSITVVYNDDGNSVEVRHGGRGGLTRHITLDFPEEYLICVAGFAADFHGSYVIRSLTFTTNKREYEPVGVEGGDFFYCATGEYGDRLHISSFSGRSGLYLDAIGFHLSPLAEAQVNAIETGFQLSSLTEAQATNAIKPMKKLGPWGGDGGNAWDDGRYDGGVKEIIVKYGQCIDSITMVYNDNGNPVQVRHGGPGGSLTTHISLDIPEEYLISVAGVAADFNGLYVIRSLIFTTNKRRYESIGKERGDFFYCTAEEHGDRLHISSFSGRSGLYLDAIGFHLSTLAEAQGNAIETGFHLSSLAEAQASAIETMNKLGPWGGGGGSEWDDGRYDGGVKEIIVKYGQCIDSITVVYDDNGISVEVRHGGRGGSWTRHISLDFPKEYLIGVAGFAANMNDFYVIRSLTFTTNKRKYEPIGEERGDFFYCTAGEHGDGLHISSFLGRSGSYLDAIGFHLSPLIEAQANAIETDTRLMKSKKKMVMGPWGGKGGYSWDDGTFDAVRKIRVAYDENCIRSIYVVYDDNGCLVSCLHGGVGGRSRTTITLNYPEEFLTSISGYAGRFGTLLVVRSLTFKSNIRTFETLGSPNGKHFSSETDGNGNGFRITGFFGRSGLFIDEIGVHISPPKNLGGGIRKTIRQMVRNVARMACPSSQGDGDDTEAQTELAPV